MVHFRPILVCRYPVARPENSAPADNQVMSMKWDHLLQLLCKPRVYDAPIQLPSFSVNSLSKAQPSSLLAQFSRLGRVGDVQPKPHPNPKAPIVADQKIFEFFSGLKRQKSCSCSYLILQPRFESILEASIVLVLTLLTFPWNHNQSNSYYAIHYLARDIVQYLLNVSLSLIDFKKLFMVWQ